jgi:hypothetical protein
LRYILDLRGKYNKNADFNKVQFMTNFLRYPEFLSLTLLDRETKVKFTQDIETLIAERGVWDGFVTLTFSEVDQLRRMLDYMNSSIDDDKLTLLKNNEIKIKPVVVNKLNVNNEWDNDEICKLFEEHKTVIVRAEYGGSGKSHACAHMAKLGYKVLFVSPTNVLCKELFKDHRVKSITINEFFGFGVNEENTFIKQFDSSEYNCIIFDEVYFYNISNLMKIYNYIQNNNKIILGAGDVEQLESVDCIWECLQQERGGKGGKEGC